MTWNLFLDDERFPPEDGREWVICRNRADVVLTIMSRGMPSYVSFDHDLGQDESTGHEIAKLIVDWDMNDRYYSLPEDFSFYVHSQNPIGKANIEGLLNNYLKVKNADLL
jgi:hypothetical protein